MSLAGIAALVSSAGGATVSWIYDADGSWTTALNWSSNPSLPGSNDDVVISQSGLDTLTFSSQTSQSVKSINCTEALVLSLNTLSVAEDSQFSGPLTINGGTLSGAGNVVINGTTTWSNGGMGGSGKATLNATTNISNTGGTSPGTSRAVDNAGIVNYTVTTSGFEFNITNSVFSNLASGTFNAISNKTSNSTLFGNSGTSSFNNAGTFNFSGASSTATYTSNVPIVNSGTMNVYNGILSLAAGSSNSGTINIYGDGALASGITNTGTINVAVGFNSITLPVNNNATGEVHVTSGLVTIAGGTHASGSKITGPGDIAVTDVLNFAGSINSTGAISLKNVTFTSDQVLVGSVTLNPSGAIAFTGSGNVVISGPLTWSSGQMTGAGKTTLGSASTLNLTNTLSLGRTLDNAGVMTVTGGGSSLSFSSGGIFNNLVNGTVNVNATSTATLSGGVGNSFNNVGTLNVNCTGTSTVFSGVALNNSGTVNVNQGTLTLNSGGPNTGTINVAPAGTLSIVAAYVNNGTINVNGGTQTCALSSTTSHINVNGGSLALNGTGTIDGNINVAAGGSLTIGGTYNVASSATITGGGSVTLSNVNNFAGSLSAGSITLGSLVNFNANQTWNGTVTLNTQGTTWGGSGNITIGGTLIWNNGFWAGTGKTTLTNTSVSYLHYQLPSTSVTLSRVLENSGVMTVGANGIFFSGGTLKNLADGTMTIVQAAFSNSGGTNLFSNAGTLNVQVPSDASPQTFTVSVPFTNTGTVNITSGTFISGNLNSTNSGTINVYPGGALSATSPFNNGGTINFVNGTNTLSMSQITNPATGHINVQGGTLTLTNTNQPNAGSLSVANGAQLVMSDGYNQAAGSSITGAGSVNFSGSVSDYSGLLLSTGPITISGITFNTDQNLAGPVTAGTIGGPANVTISGPFTWIANSGMTGSGKTTLTNVSTTQGVAGNAPFTLSRVIENSGVFGYNGTSPINFAGGTLNNLAMGTVNLNSLATFFNSSGTNAVNNAGTVNKNTTNTFTINVPFNSSGAVNTLAGILNLNGGGTDSGTFNIAAGATLKFFGGTHVFNSGTNFTGSGILNFGSGVFTLPGPDSFSGTTQLSATVRLGDPLSLQNSTVQYSSGLLSFGTLTSATLGGLNSIQALSLTNEASAPVALSIGNNNSSQTFSGAISGSGSLTKIGNGTQTLSGANTYSGGTTINGGTVKLGNASALGAAAGALTVSAGGTLDLNGFSPTVGALGGGGLMNSGVAGAVTLGVGSGGASGAYSGLLQDGVGVVALTKTGLGTETLSGSNGYSGGTTVNAGTLVAGHVNALGGGGLTINDGATTQLQAGLSGPVQLADLMIAGGMLTEGLDLADPALAAGDNATDFDFWSAEVEQEGGTLAEPVAPSFGGPRSAASATDIQAVPEPSALMLGAMGLVGVAVALASHRLR